MFPLDNSDESELIRAIKEKLPADSLGDRAKEAGDISAQLELLKQYLIRTKGPLHSIHSAIYVRHFRTAVEIFTENNYDYQSDTTQLSLSALSTSLKQDRRLIASANKLESALSKLTGLLRSFTQVVPEPASQDTIIELMQTIYVNLCNFTVLFFQKQNAYAEKALNVTFDLMNLIVLQQIQKIQSLISNSNEYVNAVNQSNEDNLELLFKKFDELDYSAFLDEEASIASWVELKTQISSFKLHIADKSLVKKDNNNNNQPNLDLDLSNIITDPNKDPPPNFHTYSKKEAQAEKESNIKLHISVEHTNYLEIRQNIINILIDAINRNVIMTFKYINEKNVLQHIKKNELELDRIDKATLHQPEVIKKYIALNESLLREKRALEEDQFTIYIPPDGDLEQIAALCVRIENELNTINPGKLSSEIELKISDHIRIRQDYLPIDTLETSPSADPELQKNLSPLIDRLGPKMSVPKYDLLRKNMFNMTYIEAILPLEVKSIPQYNKDNMAAILKSYQRNNPVIQELYRKINTKLLDAIPIGYQTQAIEKLLNQQPITDNTLDNFLSVFKHNYFMSIVSIANYYDRNKQVKSNSLLQHFKSYDSISALGEKLQKVCMSIINRMNDETDFFNVLIQNEKVKCLVELGTGLFGKSELQTQFTRVIAKASHPPFTTKNH